MTEIIGVRFKAGGKQYFFDPKGLKITNGQKVIVETDKGPEYGTCVRANGFVEDDAVVQPLRPVIRLATEKDEKQLVENRRKEKEAMKVCAQLVEHHQLDMKLVSVEYSFDGSKIIFFFTSEGRVDFRALVKDLAGIFRARIELRQIGVRDEARMLGGLGICGKPFCCNQFLEEFQPVSIKMAKTQNLSLNPTKISGTCGRLMCCLKYEQDAYEDAVKRCPKAESFVECPDGVGNISAVNLLKEQVKVRLEDSTEQPKSYRLEEIRVIRSGKGKRPEDYVAPPQAELEKLRWVDPDAGKKDRRFGEMSDLAARLEQYMGASPGREEQAGEEKSSSRNRRRRRGGKKESQPAQAEQPKAPVKEAPKKEQPKKQQQAQKPQQPKKEQPAPRIPGEHQAMAEETKKNPRRRRPHHRGKKPSGNGQAQQ